MVFVEGLADLPPGYGDRAEVMDRAKALAQRYPHSAISRLAALAAACDPRQIGAWVRDIDRRRIQPDVDQALPQRPGSFRGEAARWLAAAQRAKDQNERAALVRMAAVYLELARAAEPDPRVAPEVQQQQVQSPEEKSS
jgi:hypothetical protein